MSFAVKSSAVKHGALFLLILFWICYSDLDRPAHTVVLLLVLTSFLRSMYFLRPVKTPPARLSFEEDDLTDLDRPTVLRRNERHLKVVQSR